MSLFLRVPDLVFVKEGRPASDQQPYRFTAGVLQRVPILAGYVYGIARADFLMLASDSHDSVTRDYVVDLLEVSMMVRCDGMAGR